jgi:hypothetical protein
MNTFTFPFPGLGCNGRGGVVAVTMGVAIAILASLPGLPVAAQPPPAPSPPAASPDADPLVGPRLTPTEAAARASAAPGADTQANAQATQAGRPPTDEDVRIDLVRNLNNRVVEVIVTPAHVPWHYAMVNRDTQPTAAQSGGLSTPRFFRFDF